MADPTDLPPLPADHLDHPESWATGAAPATEKQKGFVKVLEKQHPDLVPSGGLKAEDMGKSEASEVIGSLKSGRTVGPTKEVTKGKDEENGRDGITGDTNVAEELDRQVMEMKKNEAEVEGNGRVSQKRKDVPKETADHAGAEDEDGGGNASGRDLGKTTQDGAMGSGVADDEKDGERKVKKARVREEEEDDALLPKPEEIPRPINPVAKDLTTEDVEPIPPAPSNGATNPGDDAHLDHPENWATGDQPATDKQKGFLKVLEKQKGVSKSEDRGMGKSKASEKIDELKNM